MANGRKLFSREERKRIYDKYDGLCHLCDLPVSFNAFTVDHITAKVNGGTHDEENLAPAHGKCNQRRGHKPVEEYKKKLALGIRQLGVFNKINHL